jgi:hypothetical protein
MPTMTEQKNLGDLLKYEAPNLYSREAVTIAAGQSLPLGAVLGRSESDGKHYAIDPGASDGTQAPIGVLGNTVDATNGDRRDGILIARHAVVAKTALVWPISLTGAQRTVYEGQLAQRGVLVRETA